MAAVSETGIHQCRIVPVSANRDERGCLYEIYRKSWPGAFYTVQWNACASSAGVVRGVHVHVDYHEFYTLPRGQVVVGLIDIRRESPTFMRSAQFEWSDQDGIAIAVPIGVAHVIYFRTDSVLAFGLSDYWRADLDVIGCQWDDPALKFDWTGCADRRSERDRTSGSLAQMIADYEAMRLELKVAAA